MSAGNGPALDRARALMMAALDGECTDSERCELEAAIAARPELAEEWNRLRRVKEVTMTMELRQPPEEVWDRFRGSVLHRAERSVAWTLIALGGAVLAAWTLWRWVEEWLATDMPLVIRIASITVCAGLLLLLVSVIRERWFLHRRDPYSKEVTR